MTKPELVKKVQEALNARSAKVAQEALDKVVAVVVEAVKAGEEVTLGELGKLSIRTQAARTCHNPKTGELIQVPEKKGVKLKISTKLKKAINE